MSFSVNWDALLAEDGSLPYVFPLGTVAPVDPPAPAPVAKRSAVAPRRRHDDGIQVTEIDSNIMGIADCILFVETRWTCPGCRGHFKKAGRHNGILRACKNCGARYFLRVVPVG